ncbi:hypothetical protein K435DRAFT_868456 [Dendrothele bispora CBS 962.96]|uniref:Uncharacterized protein n=1 Tax=Dendrothele bispora (strain CBS 962.96) TaxID=1314807 RepID=A0A4S8LBQ4_DENBC|nr:hypothetical protein K435DRAFT_868456 [Dendrothele bispora CBS 962.96]
MTTAYTLDAFSTNVSSFDADPVDYQLLIPGNSGFLHTKVPNVEYHWGLGKGDFKTDSPVNQLEGKIALELSQSCFLFLNSSQYEKTYQTCSKRGRISIVPTLDTLEKMLKVVESHEGQTGQPRPYTESFPVQEYEYVLVTQFFKGTIYVRNPASGEVQSFESPYQGLPSFLSHAHPYCVALWCAGGILTWFLNTLSRSPWGSRTCTTLLKLLHAWYFKEAPLAFIAGPDYENEGSEDLASDSCDSEFKHTTPPQQKPRTTNPHRFYDGYLSTRKRQNIESWIDSTRAADQDQEQIFPHS